MIAVCYERATQYAPNASAHANHSCAFPQGRRCKDGKIKPEPDSEKRLAHNFHTRFFLKSVHTSVRVSVGLE